MSKKALIGLIVIILIISTVIASIFLTMSQENNSVPSASDTIGVITIEGVIGETTNILEIPQVTGDPVEQIRKAQEDNSVKAVVVKINSPGGSAAKSVEIYTELKRLKETGKKVIISMGDAAASGGYMAACGGDIIVANPATITGSIGVIMQYTNYEGLYDKLGLKEITIKSGPYKDMGSPTRDLTPEEKKILQGVIDDTYEQFVEIVSEGRKMPVEKVKELADGRIFTGRQAVKAGLVDKLGDFYDAVDIAAKEAGIKGKPVLKYYTAPSPWSILFGNTAHSTLQERGLQILRVLFIDKWLLNSK
ncbi:signal peptide peptidase A. Serine peptidase. MEROPS family S49 [Thermoanaerobacter uzonensis DSM 18761]|uniref:Signal peptide peptidase A. Serine peptidase. MEROPS family S49 n=1 Tax=Thermoanaerobacter uzonensis DSM 18761 TaxID=1123369 RepID=A0A1M4Z0M4_9THEO|nr:signal peptide peptidase SppA [Thermoanaerobacter uzonensis]SHF11601.1 signal peptide peptidase A. Serine peptidase. MEROPS family S49 [Thermoanaerobacter uzonensis DSM 18761]